jgi:hypothetical protein
MSALVEDILGFVSDDVRVFVDGFSDDDRCDHEDSRLTDADQETQEDAQLVLSIREPVLQRKSNLASDLIRGEL